MYICEYCGRHLKNKYDNCPACGGTSFEKVQNIGEEILKVPPKDGYRVNLKNHNYEKKAYISKLLILALGLAVVLILPIVFIMTGISDDDVLIKTAFVIGGLFFLVSFTQKFIHISKDLKKMIQDSNKEIKKIEYLAKNGTLIKNLKYTVKPISENLPGVTPTYKIQVIYEIENGKTMCFESEPKYLTALGRDDGTVDLLIDLNDYTNYFIDFEIY